MKLTKFLISMLFLPLLLLSSFTLQKDKEYGLFNKKGKHTSYEKLLKAAQEADIILFGEMHDNAIAHKLQADLTRDLHLAVGNKLVLGAEMFERDNAEILNQYVAGTMEESEFEKKCRFWPNYKTDYRPMVEFARANKIKFIGTNIPRKLASLVYKGGFEALDTISNAAKTWMAPLPIQYDSTLPGYKGIFEMAGGHAGQNLPKSQAIKDATMAHFILQNYTSGQVFLHFNGSFHSNNFDGIYWYLKQANPNLKIMTIANSLAEKPTKKSRSNKKVADFIIVTKAEKTEAAKP